MQVVLLDRARVDQRHRVDRGRVALERGQGPDLGAELLAPLAGNLGDPQVGVADRVADLPPDGDRIGRVRAEGNVLAERGGRNAGRRAGRGVEGRPGRRGRGRGVRGAAEYRPGGDGAGARDTPRRRFRLEVARRNHSYCSAVLSFLACAGVRRNEVMDPHATVPVFLVAKVEINGNPAQGYGEMTFP